MSDLTEKQRADRKPTNILIKQLKAVENGLIKSKNNLFAAICREAIARLEKLTTQDKPNE